MTRSFGAQIGMAIGGLAFTYFTMMGPAIAGNRSAATASRR